MGNSIAGGGSISPYYFFGWQKWYADSRPHGMPMPASRASTSRELSGYGGSGLRGSLTGHTLAEHSLSGHSLSGHPFEESGAPTSLHYPALAHHPSLGDWPALRPAGPEPLDPGVTGEYRLVKQTGLALGLSDMEKKAGVVLALGAVGFLWWKRRKGRRRR
jgi:hypothetical protein